MINYCTGRRDAQVQQVAFFALGPRNKINWPQGLSYCMQAERESVVWCGVVAMEILRCWSKKFFSILASRAVCPHVKERLRDCSSASLDSLEFGVSQGVPPLSGLWLSRLGAVLL